MSKKGRKIGIHLTLDEDEYEDYRRFLRGTKFDKNGEVNASSAIRDHIKSVNDERKKMKALGQSVQDRSAIKQLTDDNTKQTTLERVCPDWILDHRNTERRDKTLESLGVEDLKVLGISCRNTGNAIMSRLPKQTFAYKDNLRKKKNLETTTAPDEEEDYLQEEVEEEIIIE